MTKEEQVALFSYDDLNGFIQAFLKVQDMFVSEDDFNLVFKELEKYLIQNGITYCEAFFAPSAFLKKGFSYEKMVDIFHKQIKRIQEKDGITIKLLMDVSRTFGCENAMKNYELLKAYPCPDIIGIGLGGAEAKGPAKEYAPVFQKALSEGYKAVAHAGEEFTALPSPYTRQRYIDYLNLGADMVIAHHPHVPMNFEIVDGKPIFYSLGNFIFDTDYQRSQFNTQYGIFLKIKFTKDNFEFVPFGIEIDRVNERIIKGDIPKIFVDVQKDEYDKLIPLASKMFIENTKRQLKYLSPKDFENATEEAFVKIFYEPLRSGRVPGECLDMQIIYPLSLKADEGKWKDSKLENVKEFILEQL